MYILSFRQGNFPSGKLHDLALCSHIFLHPFLHFRFTPPHSLNPSICIFLLIFFILQTSKTLFDRGSGRPAEHLHLVYTIFHTYTVCK